MVTIKKLFLLPIPLVLVCTVAIAATWYEQFVSDLKDGTNIDDAVRVAVNKDNKTPDEIIKAALTVERINEEEEKKQHLVKALFCNKTKPEEVQRAALQNELTPLTIWQGYNLAITECKRQLEEWYNYIPPGGWELPPGYASPSNFQKSKR